MKTREITCKLIEMIDEGVLDAKVLLFAALSYMSEADVRDMAELNGFITETEEEES